MIDPATPLLHVGYGPELTFQEYLYRVLLHLAFIGGVTLAALRSSDVIGAIRAAVSPRRGSGE